MLNILPTTVPLHTPNNFTPIQQLGPEFSAIQNNLRNRGLMKPDVTGPAIDNRNSYGLANQYYVHEALNRGDMKSIQRGIQLKKYEKIRNSIPEVRNPQEKGLIQEGHNRDPKLALYSLINQPKTNQDFVDEIKRDVQNYVKKANEFALPPKTPVFGREAFPTEDFGRIVPEKEIESKSSPSLENIPILSAIKEEDTPRTTPEDTPSTTRSSTRPSTRPSTKPPSPSTGGPISLFEVTKSGREVPLTILGRFVPTKKKDEL